VLLLSDIRIVTRTNTSSKIFLRGKYTLISEIKCNYTNKKWPRIFKQIQTISKEAYFLKICYVTFKLIKGHHTHSHYE